jgi:hypothetical protein
MLIGFQNNNGHKIDNFDGLTVGCITLYKQSVL